MSPTLTSTLHRMLKHNVFYFIKEKLKCAPATHIQLSIYRHTMTKSIPYIRHDGRFEVMLYDCITLELIDDADKIKHIIEFIKQYRDTDPNFCTGFLEGNELCIGNIFEDNFDAEENLLILSSNVKDVIFSVRYEDFCNPIMVKHEYLNGKLISYAEPYWIVKTVKEESGEQKVKSLEKLCIRSLARNIKYINFRVLPDDLVGKVSHAIAKREHDHICNRECWDVIV